MEEKSNVDIWLDRFVKFIGIVGFVGSAIIATTGFFFLPGRVDANQAEISKIKDWEQRTDNRLTVIEQDVKYLVKGIDEIKGSLKYNERRRSN